MLSAAPESSTALPHPVTAKETQRQTHTAVLSMDGLHRTGRGSMICFAVLVLLLLLLLAAGLAGNADGEGSNSSTAVTRNHVQEVGT
jgi:hypothetical protein